MYGKVPLLIRIIHPTYGRYIRRKMNIVFKDSSGVDLSQGPFLLLSNHVGAYDPIVISASLPRHVRWVAGAYLFKMGLLRWVLEKGATAIPKQQGRSDMSSLKAMQQALKNGDIVGIFPEGTRTWDGDLVDLDYKALAKMIRIFRCPILFVSLEGGYAECPRWSDDHRKGGVTTVHLKSVMSAEEIQRLPLPDFQAELQARLHYSNDEWKQTNPYGFVSARRAEKVERVLYLCPRCKTIGTIRSKGDAFCCTCGAKARLTALDDIASTDFPYETIASWHRWEKDAIVSFSSFPEEKGVLFQLGDADNKGKLETISEDLSVTLENLVLRVVDNRSEKKWEIPFSSITSFVLNAKQTMELYADGVLYRIRLLPDSSSLKYLERWESARNKE